MSDATLPDHEYLGFSHCLACARKAKDSMKAELDRLSSEAAALRALNNRWIEAATKHYPVNWAMDPGNPELTIANIADGARAELEEYRLRLAGALIASEGGNGCPDDAIEAIRTCPTIKSVMALRAALARVTAERDKYHRQWTEDRGTLDALLIERDAALAEVGRVKTLLAVARDHIGYGVCEHLDDCKCPSCLHIVNIDTALTPPAPQQEKHHED